MPIEPLLQRFRAAGVEVPRFADENGQPRCPSFRELWAAASENRLLVVDLTAPLMLLLRQGRLVAKGEDADWGPARAAAGARYGRLRDLHYGGSAKAQSFGYVAPASDDEIAALVKRERNADRVSYSAQQRDWIAEETLRRMQRALARHGRLVVAIVNAVAVHGNMPRPEHVRHLRSGLAALCTVDPVRQSDVPTLEEVA